MRFGDKLRFQRGSVGISQQTLADAIGVTRGSISNYEKGLSYPQNRTIYTKLAKHFGVHENYFKAENEETDDKSDFLDLVKKLHGKRASDQSEFLLQGASALFAGGELTEDEGMAFLLEMQRLYLDSKERAKKFAPKGAKAK